MAKAEQKYLRFTEAGTSASGKTRRWQVFGANGPVFLGAVDWSSHWRRYVFAPDLCTEFDAGCLAEIVVFLNEQNRSKKEADDVK